MNIEAGNYTKSQAGFTGSDGRFAKFENMDQGFAAAENLLGTYHSKHGINTISGVINRWAPASDGNPVSAYASKVAKEIGVDPDQPIDLANPVVRARVASSMAKFENGVDVPRSTDISAQSKPKGNFFDQFDEAKPSADATPATPGVKRVYIGGTQDPKSPFSERIAGDGTGPGLIQQPTTDRFQRMAIDFNNEMAGAGQLTTSNIGAQSKNLISDKVQEGDDGNAYFVDPKTGKLTQADKAQHVILTDPADNQLKVYARTDETDEGRMSAAGRLLRVGTMTSAPTVAATEKAVGSALLTGGKAAATAVTEGQQVAQAAERVGVDLPRAVTSDTLGAQQAGKLAANVPLAGLPLRKASQTAIQQMDDVMTASRAGYGSGNPATAGAAIREGVTEAIKSGPIKQRVNALYDKVDNLVDPTAVGPMPNTQRLASAIEARRVNGALPQSAKVAELEEALSRKGMNYEGIKDLRSYFGEMLDGSKVIPDGLGQKEVKQIYGALSDDMRLIIARAGGPEGLAAYKQAEKAAAKWSQVREDLQRVLNLKSEEAIFSKVIDAASSRRSADLQLLGRVRGAVGPEKWNEVASALIEKLGRAPDGTFSPDRLLGPSGLGGLSEAGKKILFRSTGQMSHADAIDDIATIAKRWKSLNQFANPSGTGQSASWSAGTLGAFVDPVSTVSAFVGSAVLAKVLSTPASSRSMAAWSRAYERAVRQPTVASIEGFKQASKLFATNVGRDIGKPEIVGNFTKQLQGAVPAAADGEEN
ncbi:TPA: hypothetical protein PIL23_002670 [Staphylococcus aureus]|nr:hypothetical protein [Staphylococcus aureus]